MISFCRSWLFTAFYFVGAACFFVMIRFVGLASIPAFATLDHESLDVETHFKKAVLVGVIIGTIFHIIFHLLKNPKIRRRPYWVYLTIQFSMNFCCVCLVLILVTGLNIISDEKQFSVEEFLSRLVSVNFIEIGRAHV